MPSEALKAFGQCHRCVVTVGWRRVVSTLVRLALRGLPFDFFEQILLFTGRELCKCN